MIGSVLFKRGEVMQMAHEIAVLGLRFTLPEKDSPGQRAQLVGRGFRRCYACDANELRRLTLSLRNQGM